MITLTKQEAQQMYEVPLIEQLESVPKDARLCIDDADGMGTHYFPIGSMCHEAAEALRAKLSEPEIQLGITYEEANQPEPVAWLNKTKHGTWSADAFKCEGDEPSEPLYTAPPQRESELEPVGNTLTFMTRAIFNVIAKHQEINGGYFIADGDIDDFIERLAKVINSTFEPLKPKNTTPPQREWVSLTEEDIRQSYETSGHYQTLRPQDSFAVYALARAIEAKSKEKNAI